MKAMTIYKQLSSKPKDPSPSDDFEEYLSDEEDRAQAKESKKSNWNRESKFGICRVTRVR